MLVYVHRGSLWAFFLAKKLSIPDKTQCKSEARLVGSQPQYVPRALLLAGKIITSPRKQTGRPLPQPGSPGSQALFPSARSKHRLRQIALHAPCTESSGPSIIPHPRGPREARPDGGSHSRLDFDWPEEGGVGRALLD